MNNNTREKLAKAIGFGGRCFHDVSSNADEFWTHSTNGSRQRYLKQADAALDLIRDNITLSWDSKSFRHESRCGGYQVDFDQPDWHLWLSSRAGKRKMLLGGVSVALAKAAALEHYRNTIMSEIGG